MDFDEQDLKAIQVDEDTEQRVQFALDGLIYALGNLGGPMAEAAESYLRRGDPEAPPTTVAGVIADMQMQVLWLAHTLGVDLRSEIENRQAYYEKRSTRLSRIKSEWQDMTDKRANHSLVQEERCLFLLATGVTLRAGPGHPPVWGFQRVRFQNSVVQSLIRQGFAATRGDGASGIYLAATKAGMEAWSRLAEPFVPPVEEEIPAASMRDDAAVSFDAVTALDDDWR
ncbi:MAG: hypothetical protein SF002_04490 [Alphaproteobacteria bacterium]|nr:hypothetical protein [Alphaproteobacteria bacterium]